MAFDASKVLAGGGLNLPSGMPGMPPINVSTSSRSGDIYASNSFSTGSFGGGGMDLGGMAAQYWPLLLVGAGVLWYVKRKK